MEWVRHVDDQGQPMLVVSPNPNPNQPGPMDVFVGKIIFFALWAFPYWMAPMGVLQMASLYPQSLAALLSTLAGCVLTIVLTWPWWLSLHWQRRHLHALALEWGAFGMVWYLTALLRARLPEQAGWLVTGLPWVVACATSILVARILGARPVRPAAQPVLPVRRRSSTRLGKLMD